ncbi:hypothetical protein SFRURICE_008311 [Spodoptera frugiperda]|nr:hypothetical protein SFRURICE_008311 [Spodoptera frugiperda]
MPKTRGQTAIENRSSDSDEEFTDTRVAGTAADDNMAAASPTTTDRRDTNMITMSEDQLSRILASVMRGSTQPPAAGVHAVHTAQSNFTRCTARFDGAACNADVVEAFIESVLVYKECAGVSDDHALRGLPMLLTGDAAVWWRGVRPTVESWDDALRRLRFMYGAARPAHRVLRDIFATEQQSESADVYISRVRANISRLPYPLPEQMQLDIVYGLLHRRIRKRVPRDSTTRARCKRFGHTMDECKSKGNELACYGCGREGVIRSKCPTCKGKCKEDAPAAAADGKRTQLNQLIISKAARFATEGPATSYATHHIRVGERQEPTASPPYRMSAGKKQLLDGELEKLLRADVIEECESPWAANVVLVKKKDGGPLYVAPADVRDNQLKDPELKTIVEDLEDSDPSRGRGWSERGTYASFGDIVSPVREKRKRGRPRKVDASPNARALCPN